MERLSPPGSRPSTPLFGARASDTKGSPDDHVIAVRSGLDDGLAFGSLDLSDSMAHLRRNTRFTFALPGQLQDEEAEPHAPIPLALPAGGAVPALPLPAGAMVPHAAPVVPVHPVVGGLAPGHGAPAAPMPGCDPTLEECCKCLGGVACLGGLLLGGMLYWWAT